MVVNISSTKTLRLIVADDQPIFIEGLRIVLSSTAPQMLCEVKAVARDSRQILELIRENDADLLLMDMNLLDPENLKLLPELKKSSGKLRVIVMTSYDDPRLVKAAFRAGADGYLLKNSSREELLRAIQEVVLSGNTFMGKGVAVSDRPAGETNGANRPDDRFMRKYGLTRREMEVMRYIGQAFSNKDIADQLFISDQTVSVHRKNIMRKIGVKSTASLIKIAFEHNLV
ncbi:MAG: LuxR C-terminal-related transcriptional regulator [Saprospiraceae bacterium]